MTELLGDRLRDLAAAAPKERQQELRLRLSSKPELNGRIAFRRRIPALESAMEEVAKRGETSWDVLVVPNSYGDAELLGGHFGALECADTDLELHGAVLEARDWIEHEALKAGFRTTISVEEVEEGLSGFVTTVILFAYWDEGPMLSEQTASDVQQANITGAL